MNCSAECGQAAAHIVTDGGEVLLMLCPDCLHFSRRVMRSRRLSARPLRRGA